MAHENFSRRQRNLLWTVRILLAVVFALAGTSKLLGLPMMVAIFEHVGLGQWFRYVTGAIEAGSAVLLLTPRYVGAAASLLAATMACAVLFHLVRVPGSPAPAAMLLGLCVIVAWFYRERTLTLVGVSEQARSRAS